MSVNYQWKRLRDLGRVLKKRSAFSAREYWSRDRLQQYQAQRLGEIVAYASRHSPFYRELYGGVLESARVELQSLPVVTKAMMLENFDRVITAPSLQREELTAYLATVSKDRLYHGNYRIMCTSGSTGEKAIHVYDRDEWRELLAGSLRWTAWMGVQPTLPRRTRLAAIGAPDAKHMTYRGAASVDVGLFSTLRLAATQPLAELVARLNAFQPDFLTAYPSVAALLAAEQLEGRLNIAPRVLCTSSELRTEEMAQRIAQAWRVPLFNCWATTETGIGAVDCEQHNGLHIFEDQTIVEVVDAHNRPVATGEPGEKILLTSLYRRVQPILRMEVSDILSIDDAPCACGRSFRRIAVLAGRADDVLRLPALRGGEIALHPIHLRSPIAKIGAVRQYQIVQQADALELKLVLAAGASSELVSQQAASLLRQALSAQGVAPLAIRVHTLAAIERESGPGKFKLVKSNVTRERVGAH